MEKESRDVIEEAFGETTRILFGRRLSGLVSYKTWLLTYVGGALERSSAIGGGQIFIPNMVFYASIKKNLVTLGESIELGLRSISLEEVNSLTLANASLVLEPIKFITSDVSAGEITDVRESAVSMNSSHCLGGVFYMHSTYCAYSFWPRETDHAFGCHFLFASKFCIQCHNSVALNRCFEMTDSNKCSDSYFCHNCENCTDCMFCFNVKSMRYAIGNVELGREKFMEIKKRLLREIADRLERDKHLEISIYSLSESSICPPPSTSDRIPDPRSGTAPGINPGKCQEKGGRTWK